jgi:tRNA 5-methylaminomethyl-2-thiouridine biosynthesis bifunctional protein
MPDRIEPAEPAYDASGVPFSRAYGDVYHSADSGPGQARHVFLGGNDLPARWAGARVFTIVETGFGLGLNFLATWDAWRRDPRRPQRLHFVSIENHPFSGNALAELHARYTEFAPLAAELRAAWPVLVPGMHRLHFEGGGVTLTLALGDAADVAPQLRFGADAFYLDGFAPERNPAMWSLRLMKRLARLAREGATLATYTTARPVKDAVVEAGFAIEKRPGFGRKQEMLAARFVPRWERRRTPPPVPVFDERRAIVIGAGIAGASACERLASRGWLIELIERHDAPAGKPPAMHAGAFHSHISRDDSVLSRLTRAGFLYALNRWRALEAQGLPLAWSPCGLLQIGEPGDEERRMAETLALLGYPPNYASFLDREAASAHAGCALPAGGWWFPQGGWLRAASLIGAQLASARQAAAHDNGIGSLVTHFGRTVGALRRDGGRWFALDEHGGAIASAPVVLLANAHDAARLANVAQPLASLRGQVTHVPASLLPALQSVVVGRGYVLPAIDGVSVVGATVSFDDDDPAARADSHAENLARLQRLLPGCGASIDIAALQGTVGFRCVAPDRLPLAGAMPDLDAARGQRAALVGVHAPDLPRVPGLYGAFAYGSRGLIWAALAGELVASQIEGEPPPLDASLADAIDPGRFAIQRLRHGRLEPV